MHQFIQIELEYSDLNIQVPHRTNIWLQVQLMTCSSAADTAHCAERIVPAFVIQVISVYCP